MFAFQAINQQLVLRSGLDMTNHLLSDCGSLICPMKTVQIKLTTHIGPLVLTDMELGKPSSIGGGGSILI